MKIKRDFVTNSSSTSYVVLLPADFTLKQNELEDISNSCEFYDLETKAEKFKYITDLIDELKVNEILYGCDVLSGDAYLAIINLLREKKLILTSIDSDSDRGTIELVDIKVIEQFVIDNMNSFNLITSTNKKD